MTPLHYFNEIEPFAAQWLRNLGREGHIPSGTVDTRSIVSVRGREISDFTQCHFFAGIGGWSLALRLAGWSPDIPVWTGSCPCQPFSSAGRRRGTDDIRHLWPEWFRLIRKCGPPVIFGEQVASPDGLKWLSFVCSDLEAEGYAIGTAVLTAAGIGSPHTRSRIYFVARSMGHPMLNQLRGNTGKRHRTKEESRNGSLPQSHTTRQSSPIGVGLADTNNKRFHRIRIRLLKRKSQTESPETTGSSQGLRLGHPNRKGSQRRKSGESSHKGPSRSRGLDGFWEECDWLPCTDGRQRPVEPGTFPLAYGIPNRVGLLRAYGNAIVPQVAATFIRAFMESHKGFGL